MGFWKITFPFGLPKMIVVDTDEFLLECLRILSKIS